MLQPSCCNRFGLGKGFYAATWHFYVAIEFGQGEEILCRDREFDVVTELPEIMSRQRVSGHGVSHVTT